MSFSRRAFVKRLGAGGAGALSVGFVRSPRALAAVWSDQATKVAGAPRPLLLHNNENPLGPGDDVLDAIRALLRPTGAEAGRYIGNVRDLGKAIAARFSVAPENVLIGNGSSQLLQTATWLFTSKTKPLVTGSPSYEECSDYAGVLGSPVRSIPLDGKLRLDLDAMADASKGAGLVFLNNPNNPTATVHSGDAIAAFIDRVLAASPETTIVVDEAYHDYVRDPSYASQATLAVRNPRVLVARTFSKAHGMAGLRVGYAIGHAKTIETMRRWHYSDTLNLLGVGGAIVSIGDAAHLEKEKARNAEVRAYTTGWFERAGFTATDSQTNFLFVDVRRAAKEFREACRRLDVQVGRDFPPYEKSHVRISLGTMDEMRRATEVFGKVLGVAATAAAA